MHLYRFKNNTAAFKSSFQVLTCVFLVVSLTLAGCSKTEKTEQPKEDKPVVTEMNISTESSEPAEPKKDEVESLPLDSGDDEEQLPELGSGG